MGQTKIKIERYKDPAGAAGWEGFIEPENKQWVLYFASDGKALFWAERAADGSVIGEPVASPK